MQKNRSIFASICPGTTWTIVFGVIDPWTRRTLWTISGCSSGDEPRPKTYDIGEAVMVSEVVTAVELLTFVVLDVLSVQTILYSMYIRLWSSYISSILTIF